MSEAPLVEVREVSKHFGNRSPIPFRSRAAPIRAVDGVSFVVRAGESFGLVGESGCGKSTLARLLLRLTTPSSGQILFRGRDLVTFDRAATRSFRRAVQAVFQDPFGSLNPRLRIGYLVAEPLIVQGTASRSEIDARVEWLLGMVGLPTDAARRFPHEFSGGQRQRIAIARALASSPDLIVLDEPVSALDVSIRGQVLNLLADVQEQTGVAYVLIAHDLAIAQHMNQRIGVMYLGKLVEVVPADDLHLSAKHPYTRLLLASVPPLDLAQIDDSELPSAQAIPSGCRFRTRCPYAMPICAVVEPPLAAVAPEHLVACHLFEPSGDVSSRPTLGATKGADRATAH